MRKARILGIAAVTVVVAAVAVAQTTVNPLPEQAPAETTSIDAAAAPAAIDPVAELANTHWGDPQAGAAKAGACAACHGLDGNGTDPALYPRLAGLGERYIASQLALFKSGQRVNDLMSPYAMPLTAQDMRDIGAYFTGKQSGAGSADDREITDPTSPYAGQMFYQPGQQLYRVGDASRDIPACMACHSPAGVGNPGAAYPHIGGQQDWYVARRLREYRSGETTVKDRAHHDIMVTVARNLTDEEILSLASYIQGLHDRGDQPSAAHIAEARATMAAAPAPVPAPTAADATATN